jgi:hypothetical protein
VSAWPLQFVLDFLFKRNLLRLSLAVAFAATAAAILVLLARRGAGRREWTALALVGVVYAASALSLSIVQERVHLIEYGAVAWLFLAALEAGERPARVAAAAAFALTAAGGLVDELIQGALPNRHYDTRDVVVNAFAGALAIGAVHLLRAARGRDLAAREATT